MAEQGIDWEFWLTLPAVMAWQAVALSMGMNPERMNQSRDYWKYAPDELDVPNMQARERFRERLRQLVSGRTDPRLFSSQSNSSDTPANHRVALREMASWLQGLPGAVVAVEFEAALCGALVLPLNPIAQHGDVAANPPPAHILPPAYSAAQAMQRWQENQILRTTRSLGYDPLGLPTDEADKPFRVKSAIRARCEKNHPVKLRAAIFNKAWDRMLARSPALLRYVAAARPGN